MAEELIALGVALINKSINVLRDDYNLMQHNADIERRFPVGKFIENPYYKEELAKTKKYRPVPLAPDIDPEAWSQLAKARREGMVSDIAGNILKPSLEPGTTPLVPIMPVGITNETGFVRDNYDFTKPKLKIARPIIGPPVHPSSVRLGNAAMPYNTQGFTKRSQR